MYLWRFKWILRQLDNCIYQRCTNLFLLIVYYLKNNRLLSSINPWNYANCYISIAITHFTQSMLAVHLTKGSSPFEHLTLYCFCPLFVIINN